MDLFLLSAILLIVSLISYVDELMSEPPDGLKVVLYALAMAESFVCITLQLGVAS